VIRISTDRWVEAGGVWGMWRVARGAATWKQSAAGGFFADGAGALAAASRGF